MIRYITVFTLGLILATSCRSLETKTLMSQQYIKDGKAFFNTTLFHMTDSTISVNGKELKYEARLILPAYTVWYVNKGQVKWHYGNKIVFSDSKGHDFCTLVYLLEKN